jgi:DNA-binding NtrC family response regulator
MGVNERPVTTYVARHTSLQTMVGDSRVMQDLRTLIWRVGRTRFTVLVEGESGVGKELVAREIHACSHRRGGAFVAVNCAAIVESLLEAELFGIEEHTATGVRGRPGKFELADGGTLFMDEIGNIPMGQQAKLLRTIETGEFERVGSSRTHRASVRLIAATNADLAAEVAAGRFRQDLLFRLNTIHLHLPPLRERREDIELLAQHFLKQHVARYHKGIAGFDETAVAAMRDYGWPGNVRELDHAVERGVLMAQGKTIRAPDLGLTVAREATPRLEEMSIEEVEAFLIKKTLARCDGNARRAAEDLGLSRSAFYRRLEKYGL